MAKEGLTLTPPTGSAIDLNGTKWGLEALNIGQPGRREDLLSSLDADGGIPARVSPRDVREVTATVRLLDAANMNAALNSIADLERVLESAERLAASNPTNPVLDLVRLVYTPAGSTYSYSLIVLTAEVAEIPREMSGDGLGFYIARPVVTIRAICDPFAYGTTGTTPFTTTYLDTTTTSAYAASATVAGGTGDVSPWLRLKVKDVASFSRGRILAGVKTGEGATEPVIAAGSMTAIAGVLASGVITASSTRWITAASIPQQTRIGTFRAYLLAARATASTGASVRFVTAEVGGSKKTGPTTQLTNAGLFDPYLGEVTADSGWNGWIEVFGDISFAALLLVPTDSFVEVASAAPGRQMTSTATIADTLASSSTNIAGRTLTIGTGTWSTASIGTTSGDWPVSVIGARRQTTNQTGTRIAIAGTGNRLDVDLRWRSSTILGSTETLGTDGLLTGAVARYVGTNDHLQIGWINEGTGNHLGARPYIIRRLSGSEATIWKGEKQPSALDGRVYYWSFQVTADGRWSIEIKQGEAVIQTASGQDSSLAEGQTLGNASNSKVGLIDRYTRSTPSITRDLAEFSASPLVGVTPAPIPVGGALTLAGPKMTNDNGAEYPYNGSSGIKIEPGVNNNLTVMARASSSVYPANDINQVFTTPLDLDIDGYPRFISVPHQ